MEIVSLDDAVRMMFGDAEVINAQEGVLEDGLVCLNIDIGLKADRLTVPSRDQIDRLARHIIVSIREAFYQEHPEMRGETLGLVVGVRIWKHVPA